MIFLFTFSDKYGLMMADLRSRCNCFGFAVTKAVYRWITSLLLFYWFEVEDSGLVGCDAASLGRWIPTFTFTG